MGPAARAERATVGRSLRPVNETRPHPGTSVMLTHRAVHPGTARARRVTDLWGVSPSTRPLRACPTPAGQALVRRPRSHARGLGRRHREGHADTALRVRGFAHHPPATARARGGVERGPAAGL